MEYYRHRMTGIMGKLEITPAGEKVIRADEGWTSDLCDWVREKAWRPVQRSQLAIAAFAIDAAICALFTHRKPNDWASLNDNDKSYFIQHGPRGLTRNNREHIEMRQSIYDFVMTKLEDANKE